MSNVNPTPTGPTQPGGSSPKDPITADSQKFKEAMKIQKVDETDEELKKKKKLLKEEEEEETPQDQPAPATFSLGQTGPTSSVFDTEAPQSVSEAPPPQTGTPLGSYYSPSVTPPPEEEVPPAAEETPIEAPPPVEQDALSSYTPPEEPSYTFEEPVTEDSSPQTSSPSTQSSSSQAKKKGEPPTGIPEMSKAKKAKKAKEAKPKAPVEAKKPLAKSSLESLEKISQLTQEMPQEEAAQTPPGQKPTPTEEKPEIPTPAKLPLEELLTQGTALPQIPTKAEGKEEKKEEKPALDLSNVELTTPTTALAAQFGSLLPQAPEAPPEAYFSQDVQQLYEKMVGLVVYSNSQRGAEGVKTVEVTLNAPGYENSKFGGLKIVINEYATAHGNYNIELQGDAEQVALLQKNVGALMEAFKAGNYNFQVKRIDVNLKSEKSEKSEQLFKRKESISDSQTGDKGSQP